MVMMDLLHRTGHAGAVVHFDHGLRDEAERRAEKELVEKEAAKRELHFLFRELAPPEEHPSRGIQHWAREERYRELYRILDERAFEAIATAHHADDRLETVLMGMLRGSGYRGVMGVPSEQDRVIRPLARVWKEELRGYAETAGIPFREDPSNRYERYMRNRIRKELMPAFRNAFPDQEGALLRSLDLLEASGSFLKEMGERERERLLRYDPQDGSYTFRKEPLKESSAPRILFFELLHPFDIPPSQADRLLENIDGLPGARVEGEEWTLIRDREAFFLIPVQGSRGDETWSIPSPEDPGNAPLSLSIEREAPVPKDPKAAVLSRDPIAFPLTLMPVQKGDRFRPFGMQEGSKTVMDHLTDRKWPVHQKERALVLCDANGWILWVIGSTIDDRFRVDEGSKELLRVRYKG